MFHSPIYTQKLSLMLSKVLDDIGVNEELVNKRRKICLIKECLGTISDVSNNKKMYLFGSQTEGSTTNDLRSDVDTVVFDNRFNVIADLRDWVHGYTNLLMVKDQNTPPGYCLLQKTYAHVPMADNTVPDDRFYVESEGRVLLRNTSMHVYFDGSFRQGPAQSITGKPGFTDNDMVIAFYCRSWPSDANEWLQRQSAGDIPSQRMRELAKHDGCFVVPVGSRESSDNQLEWRISTSITERTLMFSLNITQIRCYILMKMILKSSFQKDLPTEQLISSFMCKSVLLRHIENTPSAFWREKNLLSCFTDCLQLLYKCVRLENCPHFIIQGNNLMAARFSSEVKILLLSRLRQIIQTQGGFLLGIETEGLGERLQMERETLHLSSDVHYIIQEIESVSDRRQVESVFSNILDSSFLKDTLPKINGLLMCSLVDDISWHSRTMLLQSTYISTEQCIQSLFQSIHHLALLYGEGNQIMQLACQLLTQSLCTSLGSVLASHSISRNEGLPHKALAFFSTNLTKGISDRLKFASLFYSVGDMERTMSILRHIEVDHILENVLSVCSCYEKKTEGERLESKLPSFSYDERIMVNNTAFCVRYLRSEVSCVPPELKQELYKPIHTAREQFEQWLDWATVDAKPYFYFLLYKVHGHFGNHVKQQESLMKLKLVIETDENLGHKETALNLLGQCLEQEGRLQDALKCYKRSKDVRPHDNVVDVYIDRVRSRINH